MPLASRRVARPSAHRLDGCVCVRRGPRGGRQSNFRWSCCIETVFVNELARETPTLMRPPPLRRSSPTSSPLHRRGYASRPHISWASPCFGSRTLVSPASGVAAFPVPFAWVDYARARARGGAESREPGDVGGQRRRRAPAARVSPPAPRLELTTADGTTVAAYSTRLLNVAELRPRKNLLGLAARLAARDLPGRRRCPDPEARRLPATRAAVARA